MKVIGPVEIALFVVGIAMLAGPALLKWVKSRGGLFVQSAPVRRVSPQSLVLQQQVASGVVQWQNVTEPQDEPVTRDEAFAASETLVRYYRQLPDETGLKHALDAGRSLYPAVKSETVRKVAARKAPRTTGA
jgi:hypothetical protein